MLQMEFKKTTTRKRNAPIECESVTKNEQEAICKRSSSELLLHLYCRPVISGDLHDVYIRALPLSKVKSRAFWRIIVDSAKAIPQ